jgi:hypothetical protein
LISALCLAQSERLDKIELGSGKIMLGKVEKIKSNSVEFMENHSNDLYEFKKSEIRYIDLANGEILTFKEFNDTKGVDQAAPSSQTAEVAQDGDLSAGSIVLISVGVGYGALKMTDVNDDLNDSQSLLNEVGLNTDDPDLISGGLFLEGSLKFIISQFRIGMAVDYISSSGEYSYSDPSGLYDEKYDVSTIEITALFEIVFANKQSIAKPFLRVNGGIGLASAEHKGDFKIYGSPEFTFNVINNVSGQYFAGRFQGGAQFILNNVILELAVGYRLAEAGELKGDHIENGIKFEDMPVRDINGNGVSFDYSGFLASAGISIWL